MSEQQGLTEALTGLLQTDWSPELYQSFYDTAYCINQNVSYSNRVDAEDNFNFCSVPLSGADAFLFAGVALLVASVCMGKLQSVWLLVIGGCLGILNYEVNLHRLGNAISLWLGIQPPDLFFYAFLPPLLVDAALRLDWYLFVKLWPHIVLAAYVLPILNAIALTAFILFVLGFSGRGWDWIHGAVFAAMLAPTDAVAVTAILKAGGGPENMVVLMEGEALLNDASAVTLYTIFMGIKEHYSVDAQPGVVSQIWPIVREILKLTAVGCGLGLAFAWALGYVLRLLRWRGAKAYIESLVVLATAYLTFYVTQGPAKGSGVIAVCVFGLYGSATGHWRMLATDAESGIHEAVWDTVAFAANSLIFFWSGVSSVNFVSRAASQMGTSAWNYAAIPLIFLFMYAFRFACLVVFNPIFKLLGAKLSLPDISFATVAGLRGALTLIMAADFIIHSDFYSGGPVAEENFDIVLWASTFVLLSLLINAPFIGPVMRWTGLSRISDDKIRGRKKAVEELHRFTAESIDDLKQQQDGEFLQGANWSLVATFVDHSSRLKGFVPKLRGKAAAGRTGRKPPAAAAAAQAAGDGASAKQLPGSGGGSKGSGCGGEEGLAPRLDDEMEVPFMPHHGGSGLARSSMGLARRSMDPAAGPNLNMAALLAAARGGSRAGSHYGSFHAPGGDASGVAAAAVAAAADGGGRGSFASSGGGGGRRAVRFGSATDVSLAADARAGRPTGSGGGRATAAPPATVAGTSVLLDGEEEVEMLLDASDGLGDFDMKWQNSLERASASVQARRSMDAARVAAPATGAVGAAATAGASVAPAGQAGGGDRWTAAELQRQLGEGDGAVVASQAAAALVQRQISSVAASRAAAAGAGSNRDLLGRLNSGPRVEDGDGPSPFAAAAATTGPAKPPQQLVSAGLLSRAPSKQVSRHLRTGGGRQDLPAGAALQAGSDAGIGDATGAAAAVPRPTAAAAAMGGGDVSDLEAGLGRPRSAGCAGSPKADSSTAAAAEEGVEDESSSLHLMRLRILHGVKRHFRSKRLSGLLSPAGLRVAIYACDKAIEHAEEHPEEPLRLWEVLKQEISGTWNTHAMANMLAGTLRVHRGASTWWRKATAWPFHLFTGLLRKSLGSKMLIACEASVELYMGLAASPQMQWVYFSEDTPVAVLEEVQEQLLGAYEFIQGREAEAPAQYRAVQSYRAAMAVLRQQRAFMVDMFDRGLIDEDERDELAAAVDAAMRHLDMAGPIWRPPAPSQVVRSLEVFSGAPVELTDMLLRQAKLTELTPGAMVWSSDDGAADGFYLVVSGVVRQQYITPAGTTDEQLQGVGAMFGELAGLCGSRLPGCELVTACGNSFGRGPMVYHFPAAALAALRKRADSGDEAAVALEAELYRVAAVHTVQHVQSDVQGLVKSFLERHRPLTKYAPGMAPQQQHPERLARYTAQVLLDMLQGIPTAGLLRLRPGESYRQDAHMLLLQGSLESSSSSEPLPAPAVLPWLTHHRFSFVAAVAAAQQKRLRWQAGSSGATLMVCAGGAGSGTST